MVKPTLKPEPDKHDDDLKKDDVKLKEWGVLPATVALEVNEKEKDKKDAEAALESQNLETEIDDSPRPFLVKCCGCFAVFAIVLIVSCTIGSFLYYHYGKDTGHTWKGWCSVDYDGDDNDSAEKHRGRHGHGGGSSSSEEWPNNPRITGPPGGKKYGQQSEVNLDEQFTRIERPEESESERITIMHDYNVNISAYRLWNAQICYITYIEQEVLMDPEEFWTNMQDPAYLNQHFGELSMFYRAVLPALHTPLHEQEDVNFGEYLDGPKQFLCQGVKSYWIEKIPEEEIEAFLQMIEQVIRELMQLAESVDQWEGEGEMPMDYGGYFGMAEPMPEPGMPMAEPGRDEWMPFAGAEPHGGRDEEDELSRPYGEYPGRRHHPGGRHHGDRMRRHAERKAEGMKHGRPFMGMPGLPEKYRVGGRKTAEAKDADKCLTMVHETLKEIGKGGMIYNIKLRAPPCLMQKAQEMGLYSSKKNSF